MKWIPQDVDMYLKAKEYVDTAVIPLIPLSFGEDMIETAAMSEFITLVASLLERQATGRILLLPPFTYLTADDHEKRVKELLTWTSELKRNEVKHVFFLTSDSKWKIQEKILSEKVVWIPVLPIENLENQQKYAIIDSQAKQILDLITESWHKID